MDLSLKPDELMYVYELLLRDRHTFNQHTASIPLLQKVSDLITSCVTASDDRLMREKHEAWQASTERRLAEMTNKIVMDELDGPTEVKKNKRRRSDT